MAYVFIGEARIDESGMGTTLNVDRARLSAAGGRSRVTPGAGGGRVPPVARKKKLRQSCADFGLRRIDVERTFLSAAADFYFFETHF